MELDIEYETEETTEEGLGAEVVDSEVVEVPLPDAEIEELETALTEADMFQEWKDIINEQNPELDDATLDALWTNPVNRTWHQTELVDAALHPEYDQQVSFKFNEETGEVEEARYGESGSQRPDGIFMTEEGSADIREAKNYGNCGNLIRNMEKQTADRRELWGEDVNLTYVLSPRFTIEEAERLKQCCEKLEVDIDWQLK